VTIPRDAVAHIDDGLAEAALALMERNMAAEISPAAKCTMVSGQVPAER